LLWNFLSVLINWFIWVNHWCLVLWHKVKVSGYLLLGSWFWKRIHRTVVVFTQWLESQSGFSVVGIVSIVLRRFQGLYFRERAAFRCEGGWRWVSAWARALGWRIKYTSSFKLKCVLRRLFMRNFGCILRAWYWLLCLHSKPRRSSKWMSALSLSCKFKRFNRVWYLIVYIKIVILLYFSMKSSGISR